MRRARHLLALLLTAAAPWVQPARAADKPAPRSVSVEGAVNQPGRILFPVDRALSVVDAISLAGGFTRNADLKRVWLIRRDPSGAAVKSVVNVDALMKSGGPAPVLAPDDRIVLIGRDTDDNGN